MVADVWTARASRKVLALLRDGHSVAVLADRVRAKIRPLAVGIHKALRELRRDDVAPGAAVNRPKDDVRQPGYRVALAALGLRPSAAARRRGG